MATVIRSGSALGPARLNPLVLLRFVRDRLITRWQERRRRARELNELFSFSERELRDLGLSRSDFMSIQNGTFHRD
jgi:uncharacterized protein YjiS (DUF1127 family)